MRLRDEGDLAQAIGSLGVADPTLIGAMVAKVGRPALRQKPFGFAGLASVIVGQQVSTASAAAIFGRLCAALDPLTPQALLAAPPVLLRSCGLSAGKMRTLRAAAGAVQEGRLAFEQMTDLPVDSAQALLMSVAGIGPWTATTFLLFGLGHADAFPSGDMALQEAVRLLRNDLKRPSARELERLAERWRPHRGAAAHLLWDYYRAMRHAPSPRPISSPLTPPAIAAQERHRSPRKTSA